MKLNKWLFGAAALALMASCSDNLDGPSAPEQPSQEKGGGYIGINIQLPTVAATRANDSFDDGYLDEYVVKDATLLLFQGESEATATFTGIYTLNEAEPEYESGGQVTRHSIRVANVNGVNFDSNLYALVMVNGVENQIYTLEDPEEDWMWTDKTDAEGNKIGKTVRELQETIFTLKAASGDKVNVTKLFSQDTPGDDYASYIFMTNSPLSTYSGGATEPEGDITSPLPVLVELNPTVYPNQSLAIANPAGIIHVERAVGKVTCSKFNKATELTVKVGDHDYKLEVDKIWWDMAQDLAETYVVRNTNRNLKGTDATLTSNYMWRWNYASRNKLDDPKYAYRMLGDTKLTGKVKNVTGEGESKVVTWVNQDYFRPYFCQVPGYNQPKTVNGNSTTYEDKVFNKAAMEFNENTVAWSTTGNGDSFAGPGAFYPFENTFPVEFMRYANTTRVGFWVTFKFTPVGGAPALNMTDKNFYIKGMDKSTLYMDDANGNDPLVNAAIAELSNKTKYKAMWDAVDAALDKTGTKPGSINDVNIGDLVKFTLEDTNDAHLAIRSIEFKSLTEIGEKYPEKFVSKPEYNFAQNNNEIRTTLNNLGTYYKYEGGRAFYEVRIKHFGDDNTPWDGDSKLQATTITESYGPATDKVTRNNNYLGRYGIVRNNWYDLTVRVIKNLGYPKDPQLWDSSWPGKPDDNKDQYIAVELKVLSWAQRSQSVDF